MKIRFLNIGKATDKALVQECLGYVDRLKHYAKLKVEEIDTNKFSSKLSEEQIRNKEGELLLKNIENVSHLCLLDERGKQFSSMEFSDWMQQQMSAGRKELVFVTGGPYGFSEEVYERADARISLSKMTFTHQMVRLIFLEQLYRAYTILKNEPYHHA